METWVILSVAVASLIVLAATMAALFVMFGQKLLVKLMEKHDTARKGSKEEIESGVRNMLESNQKTLDRLVAGLEKQLKESRHEVVDLKTQNAAIREQLINTAKITEGLQLSTEGLKNLLTNNRLRGEWGEQVAEDLLLAAGFVEKVNYVKQKSSGGGRPDFTILLPDDSKLNVDSKFPFDDLIVYQEAKTPQEKQLSLKNFKKAVMDKVKEITTKDYINPENQTLDFVIMFVPNEMIFSFIYEKLPEINEYCNKNKVILAGPFGFTAVLRLILQAYRNFRYQKDLQQILGLIAKFQSEYIKFGESFERLGRQIGTTQRTYLEIEGTRNRQLTRVMDLITEHSSKEKLLKDKKEGDD